MKKIKGIILASLATATVAGAVATSVVFTESVSEIQAASLSVSEAKSIVMKSEPAGKIISVDLDGKKDGSVQYDVTVLVNSVEKEYKIDAKTGSIIRTKEEMFDDDDDDDMQLAQANPKLGFEDAEKVLQQKYPQAKVYDEELDYKSGQLVYEVKALNGTQRVKLVIDANSGQILREKVK